MPHCVKGVYPMNKQLKKISPMILLVAGVVSGLMLLISPSFAMKIIKNILGWGLIVAAVIQAVGMYMAGSRNANDYIAPVGYLIGGILVLTLTRLFKRLVPIAIGIILLISGIMKLRNTYMLKNNSDKKWLIGVGMAAFSILFGLFMIIFPASFEGIILRIIGVLILVECVDDLFALKLFK